MVANMFKTVAANMFADTNVGDTGPQPFRHRGSLYFDGHAHPGMDAAFEMMRALR